MMKIFMLFLIFAMGLGGSLVFDLYAPKPWKTNSAFADTAALPFFGFTPFPYDFTAEALDKTYEIIVPNSTIFGLHLDDGIPWREALADAPFSSQIQNEWTGWAKHIPVGQAVYLGLAPLEKDRISLAHERGEKADGTDWVDASFNDERVKKAYLNYARRAVKQFNPDFLNLGIEAGELALRKPERWPAFIELYDFVRVALKKEFPHLKIGISFGLQSLLKPEVAKLVRPAVNNSDYLCLSFYPNMSTFGEKFGAPALPGGQNTWTEPLHWVHSYTDKPIAICETGYSSKPVSVKSFDLHFPGDPTIQATYVHDLIDIAKKDKYLFVLWFLAIDYDKLYAKLADDSDVNLIWRNIGLLDSELTPKPAWSVWKTFRSTDKVGAVPQQSTSLNANQGNSIGQSAKSISETVANNQSNLNENFLLNLRFLNVEDLLSCSSGDQVSLDKEGKSTLTGGETMRWEINYLKGQWNWCYRKVNLGQLVGASIVRLHIRSDREGPIFLKLEESNKEAFYSIVSVDKDWRYTEIKLTDLKIDDVTRSNGSLDLIDITNIILADPGSVNGTTGRRNVWIDAIEFK
jgi:hypothetical protein